MTLHIWGLRADQCRKVIARRCPGVPCSRMPDAVRLHGSDRVAGTECYSRHPDGTGTAELACACGRSCQAVWRARRRAWSPRCRFQLKPSAAMAHIRAPQRCCRPREVCASTARRSTTSRSMAIQSGSVGSGARSPPDGGLQMVFGGTWIVGQFEGATFRGQVDDTGGRWRGPGCTFILTLERTGP